MAPSTKPGLPMCMAVEFGLSLETCESGSDKKLEFSEMILTVRRFVVTQISLFGFKYGNETLYAIYMPSKYSRKLQTQRTQFPKKDLDRVKLLSEICHAKRFTSNLPPHTQDLGVERPPPTSPRPPPPLPSPLPQTGITLPIPFLVIITNPCSPCENSLMRNTCS